MFYSRSLVRTPSTDWRCDEQMRDGEHKTVSMISHLCLHHPSLPRTKICVRERGIHITPGVRNISNEMVKGTVRDFLHPLVPARYAQTNTKMSSFLRTVRHTVPGRDEPSPVLVQQRRSFDLSKIQRRAIYIY